MNLQYSRKDKIKGFSFFGWMWVCGALLIVLQTQSLHYPLPVSIVAASVPLVIRIVFDYGNIHRVISGKEPNFTK